MSTASGKPAPKESAARSQELLETATQIFYERGYTATSIQDLADAMQIRKASMYHYITSKEELLYRISMHAHSLALDYLEQYDPGPDADSHTRLGGVIMANIRYQTENIPLVTVYFTESRYLGQKARREVHKVRRAYEEFVEDVVRNVMEERGRRIDLTSHQTTVVLLGMLNTVYRWFPAGESWTGGELATILADLLEHGFVTDS